ncbi:receptor protein-tyrosine kinase [Nitrosomonas sp. Nm51]|uniref:XrtA-associated tyrosine autokinase n=1 Tax=Nitrosomonas sp. Nm51 TaxID=133720 RepID=UPI0008C4BAC3|nr:XrtA-associated tyrosine autokinase [Nitrosomonas sp. Nm51]SER66143.1 receptor protein-tyrosine kinase [Nitrosomonas sp. Nm51]
MSIIEKAISKLEKEVGNKAAKISGRSKTRIKSNKEQKPVVTSRKDNLLGNVAVLNEPVNEAANTNYIDIDLSRLNQLGIVTPTQGKTQIAEQFRIIKRPLLTKAFAKKNNNLIMITSALQGEGKSFCSVNLAMSIASEMDHRVLLIDTDVARPSIPNLLGFKSQAGLMDILLGEINDVGDVLIKTNVEKLSLITVGTAHSHATELLASQTMVLLLEELAQRYNDRIVIFDAPPILLTSEARVLAERMGQIVLVVEAERTTQQAVNHVVSQFNHSKANINLIYNKVRTFAAGEYYGYYYS